MTTNIPFADRLNSSISRSNSFIVAGFDPKLEDIPPFLVAEAQKKAQASDDCVFEMLTSFYALALEAIAGKIAAIKPNIAFFEQYGLSGIRAFGDLVKVAHSYNLPVIADVKRGDIGNTASAYSAAFLGKPSILGKKQEGFDVDAVTLNPFLGFDTLEPFIKDCVAFGKGLFVLVKTSNPGSSDIQGLKVTGSDGTTKDVSDVIATWLSNNAEKLSGTCGFSGMGAVVGATYPEEARHLRSIMSSNYFLIPGMGAQGGTARDAIAGFGVSQTTGKKGGAIINLSRGLFAGFDASIDSKIKLAEALVKRADSYNAQISEALS